METSGITEWTFFEEVPIPQDVNQLLVQGEQPYAAYKTFRDSAIFTSKLQSGLLYVIHKA